MAFAKLWFPFNLRHPQEGVWQNQITRNPWLWASLALCACLLVAAVYLPGLSHVLSTAPLSEPGWLCVLATSLTTLLIGQLLLAWRARRSA